MLICPTFAFNLKYFSCKWGLFEGVRSLNDDDRAQVSCGVRIRRLEEELQEEISGAQRAKKEERP